MSSCTARGAWSDSHPTSGTLNVASSAPGTYTYNLACTGSYGSANASANLTVTNATAAQVAVQAPGPAIPCDSNCYYVDGNSGSDQNDGRTLRTAFRTIQKAASVVGPGATVTVMSGTYTTDSVSGISLTTSGTSNAWIRFIAGAGQHPVVQISSQWAWYGINISASYIVIDGFEVIGMNQLITPEYGRTGTGNEGILNEACIEIDGRLGTVPHDVVIRNSVLHDCTEAGIGVAAADAVTIAYNTVYNNSWWTWYDSSAISLFHLTDTAATAERAGYRNFIVGNTVFNNYNLIPTPLINPPGITDGNGIIIDDNRHSQNAPYRGRTYIANNIVYDNGGRGIHAFASSHVDVVNNTTYNNMLTDSPYIVVGEIDSQDCYDVNVVNNIAMNLNGKRASAADSGVYWNNLWSGSNVPMTGRNGLNADPKFVDPEAVDFTPGAGSPALGTGTAVLAPAIDINGNPRAATKIDRGAIQVSK